jgi:hypothetical protein
MPDYDIFCVSGCFIRRAGTNKKEAQNYELLTFFLVDIK